MDMPSWISAYTESPAAQAAAQSYYSYLPSASIPSYIQDYTPPKVDVSLPSAVTDYGYAYTPPSSQAAQQTYQAIQQQVQDYAAPQSVPYYQSIGDSLSNRTIFSGLSAFQSPMTPVLSSRPLLSSTRSETMLPSFGGTGAEDFSRINTIQMPDYTAYQSPFDLTGWRQNQLDLPPGIVEAGFGSGLVDFSTAWWDRAKAHMADIKTAYWDIPRERSFDQGAFLGEASVNLGEAAESSWSFLGRILLGRPREMSFDQGAFVGELAGNVLTGGNNVNVERTEGVTPGLPAEFLYEEPIARTKKAAEQPPNEHPAIDALVSVLTDDVVGAMARGFDAGETRDDVVGFGAGVRSGMEIVKSAMAAPGAALGAASVSVEKTVAGAVDSVGEALGETTAEFSEGFYGKPEVAEESVKTKPTLVEKARAEGKSPSEKVREVVTEAVIISPEKSIPAVEKTYGEISSTQAESWKAFSDKVRADISSSDPEVSAKAKQTLSAMREFALTVKGATDGRFNGITEDYKLMATTLPAEAVEAGKQYLEYENQMRDLVFATREGVYRKEGPFLSSMYDSEVLDDAGFVAGSKTLEDPALFLEKSAAEQSELKRRWSAEILNKIEERPELLGPDVLPKNWDALTKEKKQEFLTQFVDTAVEHQWSGVMRDVKTDGWRVAPDPLSGELRVTKAAPPEKNLTLPEIETLITESLGEAPTQEEIVAKVQEYAPQIASALLGVDKATEYTSAKLRAARDNVKIQRATSIETTQMISRISRKAQADDVRIAKNTYGGDPGFTATQIQTEIAARGFEGKAAVQAKAIMERANLTDFEIKLLNDPRVTREQVINVYKDASERKRLALAELNTLNTTFQERDFLNLGTYNAQGEYTLDWKESILPIIATGISLYSLIDARAAREEDRDERERMAQLNFDYQRQLQEMSFAQQQALAAQQIQGAIALKETAEAETPYTGPSFANTSTRLRRL